MRRNRVEPEELVMYHNNFHKMNISKLGSLENNLLFSIFKRLSYTDDIVFTIDDLTRMTHMNNKDNRNIRTQAITENLYKDFFSLNFKIIYPRRISYIHMFSTMSLDYEDDTNQKLVSLTIRVNPDLKYLLQDIKKQFTAFDLIQFKKLNSKYSKTLFRMLTQYSSTGTWRINFKEFKELLGIPETYKFKEINAFVLKPSVEEVSQFINGISYTVEKQRIDGKLVHTNITFKFQKFQNNAEHIESLDKEISRKTGILAVYECKRIVEKSNGNDTTELDKKISKVQEEQYEAIKRRIQCTK